MFVSGCASAGPPPRGSHSAWKLQWRDEFNKDAVDWDAWADHSSAEPDDGHGNPDHQQLEWNQRENCSVEDGILTITAKPDDITSPSGQHYDWSSCLMSSTPSYKFRYGYIEERAQLPSARGFWAAFWTWQAPGSDEDAETDVFEFYSNDHTRLHLQRPDASDGCVYRPPFDPSAGFHTYGVAIEPSGTTWYVDGHKVCTSTSTSSGMTNIVVDLFVFGEIPPHGNTVEHKRIDYIRAWTR